MRERAEHGQATTEIVALLAVVLVLVGAAAALARPGAPGVVNATLGQVRRALCVVTGAACPVQRPQPCVVSARSDRRHLSLAVSVIRVDDDHVILRERLSDGSVRLTVTGRAGAGVGALLGVEGHVTIGGRTVGIGTHVDATLLALLGRGRVFRARDGPAADRLEARLRSRVRLGVLDGPYRALRGLLGGGGDDDGPRPDEVYTEGGLQSTAGAEAGRVGTVRLDALGSAVAGVRRDRIGRRTTVYLRLDRGVGLLLSAALGAAGRLDATGLLALTLDARRRPVELSLQAVGDVGAAADVPDSLEGLLELGTPSRAAAPDHRLRGTGRRWEAEARLDLTDPRVAAAWAAFRRDPASLAAISALGARLRDRARLDVRSYATADDRSGVGAQVGYGGGVGFTADHDRRDSRLLGASTRPPGGAWEQRSDCVQSP